MNNKRNLRQQVLLYGVTGLALTISGTSFGAEPNDTNTAIKQLEQQLKAQQKEIEALKENAASSSNAGATTAHPDLKAAKQTTLPKTGGITTGAFGGPFKIPGVGLTTKIGGFVSARTLYDSNETSGPGLRGGFKAGGIPVSGDTHSNIDFTARESRIWIDSRKKTDYGALRIYFEGDFNGDGGTEVATNGSTFRLRQAYGKLGHLLAGQAWSTFVDLPAHPVLNLSYGDTYGMTVIRQAQARWTQPVTDDLSFQFAVENPDTLAFPSQGGAPLADGHNRVPDGVVRANLSQPWGHTSFMLLGRELEVHDSAANVNDQAFGYGVKLSGKVNILSRDNYFTFDLMGGKGIGRYIIDLAAGGIGSATVDPATNELDPITAYAGSLQFGHAWTDTLSSDFIYSYSKAEPKSYQPDATYDHTHVAGMDLFWNAVPHVDLGLLYLYGRKTTKGGQSGHDNRLETIAQYVF